MQKDIESLILQAKNGEQEATSRLLLHLINRKATESEIISGIEVLSDHFHNWRNSKKYFFARILMKTSKREDGLDVLRSLCDADYSPAQCKLGCILYDEASGKLEVENALSLITTAKDKGHIWAERAYWVVRGKEAAFPLNLGFFLYGLFLLARILIIRKLYDPGELTIY